MTPLRIGAFLGPLFAVAVALWLSVGAAPAARLPLRLRLKAPVDISRLPHQARVVAQALKTYGLILADNGSPSYISGAPNAHWNNGALHQLDQLTGSDFEVVNTTSLPRPGL